MGIEYRGRAPSADTELVPKSYVDAAIAAVMASARPIGEITIWPGTDIPAGWLVCSGQAVSRTQYAPLFSTLGTMYGEGDGSTTFNLPDYRGRTALGVSEGTHTHTLRVTSIVGTSQTLLNFGLDFGLSTGTAVTFSGSMPSGLTAGTTYYLDTSKGSSTQSALSTTLANALAGTNIGLGTTFSSSLVMTYSYTLSAPLGEGVGEATHRNTTSEMPSHNHSQNAHNHSQNAHTHTISSHGHGPNGGGAFVSTNGGGSANVTTGGGGYALSTITALTAPTASNNAATNIAATATNNPAGGDGLANNLPPSIVQQYLIRSGS